MSRVKYKSKGITFSIELDENHNTKILPKIKSKQKICIDNFEVLEFLRNNVLCVDSVVEKSNDFWLRGVGMFSNKNYGFKKEFHSSIMVLFFYLELVSGKFIDLEKSKELMIFLNNTHIGNAKYYEFTLGSLRKELISKIKISDVDF